MILQALTDYYRRKRNQDPGSLPDMGFELRPIDFAIVLSPDGTFRGLDDLRDMEGKRATGRMTLVPQAVKRSSGVSANLLWDNIGYVLGYDGKDKPERAREQAAAFAQRIRETFPEPPPGVSALLRFLDSDPLTTVQNHPRWPELVESNGSVTFQIEGDRGLLCEQLGVIDAVAATTNPDGDEQARCLVSGEMDTIARLHHPIKGVYGGKTTGGDIVSFNLDAFASYGKKQGANAPVGARATYAYTSALNHLLRWGSEQRLTVAGTTLVFWCEEQSEMESLFTAALADDPDRHAQAVATVFEAYHKGAPARADDDRRFFVLGLSPNAARLSVRLWQTATTRQLGERLQRHFERLRIVHGEKESDYLPIRWLLKSISVGQEDGNIPPNLAGETLRCILTGLPYPHALLSAAVRRNRAEQAVSYPRAALIKACLNAHRRNENEREITMTLDKENENVGYRLGRLFLFLEQAQAAAVGANRTLRERYFAVASTNPAAVFPRLLRMYNHNQAKLKDSHAGMATMLDRGITEVVAGLDGFPVTLGLADQGRFAIGYYHQRQAWFTKREKAPDESTEQAGAPV